MFVVVVLVVVFVVVKDVILFDCLFVDVKIFVFELFEGCVFGMLGEVKMIDWLIVWFKVLKL